jgi:hypothetical protein
VGEPPPVERGARARVDREHHRHLRRQRLELPERVVQQRTVDERRAVQRHDHV